MAERENRVAIAKVALWSLVQNDVKARAHAVTLFAELDRLRADNAFLRREKAIAWGKLLDDRPPSFLEALRQLGRSVFA